MADLIRQLLQKTRFLSAAKRATQLPNSLTVERLTTQEVCKGLRTLMETIAIEDMETMLKINVRQLAMLDEGLSWEADLASLSCLADSMSILTKSLKTSQNENEADILKKIIHRLSRVCAEPDNGTHPTMKFISLNGLGSLFIPREAESLIQAQDVAQSLLQLFISVLKSTKDDLVISEALQATEKMLKNTVDPPVQPHRKTLFKLAKGKAFNYLLLCD